MRSDAISLILVMILVLLQFECFAIFFLQGLQFANCIQ